MSEFQVFSNRTMKVTCDGDTRRGKLSTSSEATAAEVFAAIQSAACALFNFSDGAAAQMQLKYSDNEGDLCTLIPATMSDLAALAPEGVLRLTLTTGSTEADAETSAKPDLQSAGVSDPHTDGENTGPADASWKETLKDLVQKIDPNTRNFAKNMVQGQDPMFLQFLIGMAMTNQSCGQSCGEDGALGDDAKKLQDLLRGLQGMEPTALRDLLVEVLSRGVTADSSSCQPPEGNPLEAIMGLFSGKGCGKGMEPGQPCPLQGLMGAVLQGKGGKGYGKGSPAPGDAATGPVNPMADLLGALLGGKGMGKGCTPQSVPGQGNADTMPVNLMADLLGGLLGGKGMGKGFPPQGNSACGAPQQNPLELLLGTFLGGKGAGKGTESMVFGANQSTPSVDAATTSDAADGARAAFEESVDDLLGMGLVSDRQTARQLLTEHGDISAVVALLAPDN